MPCCRGLPASGPDSARSWLVAVACSWNLLWSSLVRRSTGVIYVALVSAFGITREEASWVLSISMSIAWLLGPVVGMLTKLVPLMVLSLVGSGITSLSSIGCAFARDMTAVFLLLGICSGIGSGMVLPTSEVIIGQNFRRYRGSGNGIYYTGGTLAAFAFPPILHLLLNEYGFRGAFLITGGLMLNALAACPLFRAPPRTAASARHGVMSPEGSLTYKFSSFCSPHEDLNGNHTKASVQQNGVKDTAKESLLSITPSLQNVERRNSKITFNGRAAATSCRKASVSTAAGHWDFFRAPVFYMVALTCTFSVYSQLVSMVLVDFAVEKRFTRRDGALLLSAIAVGDASARMISGFLSDRAFCDRRTLLGLSALLNAVLCVALPAVSVDYYALAALLCGLYGWGNGTVVVLSSPVLSDHLGVANLGLSSGVVRFVKGAAYLACPRIIGDHNGNFKRGKLCLPEQLLYHCLITAPHDWAGHPIKATSWYTRCFGTLICEGPTIDFVHEEILHKLPDDTLGLRSPSQAVRNMVDEAMDGKLSSIAFDDGDRSWTRHGC
ncbi:hypothetical protein HPB48_010227 [Haemaphysalis longicornis]|uniref:Monocarboxylate transporter n=1 Tax=Haemaphysalis longicornis TaxID=44386 RepID=A0A9J6GRF1_HAELO|nr:hypothetical protein HPB48_010227 [Haemaphysalis longicornis]